MGSLTRTVEVSALLVQDALDCSPSWSEPPPPACSACAAICRQLKELFGVRASTVIYATVPPLQRCDAYTTLKFEARLTAASEVSIR